MVSDAQSNASEQMTPDEGGGSAPLTIEEKMLIAAFRAGDFNAMCRFILNAMPGDDKTPSPESTSNTSPEPDAWPPELSEKAFYRLSVGIVSMLMHDWFNPDELADRFTFLDMLTAIEHVIRQEMLSGAVDDFDLNQLLRSMDYRRKLAWK